MPANVVGNTFSTGFISINISNFMVKRGNPFLQGCRFLQFFMNNPSGSTFPKKPPEVKKNLYVCHLIFKPKTFKMKKLLPVVALLVLFSACKGKKDEKKPEETTPPANTEQTTTPPPSTETTPPATSGVPTFSDPDVQKFANEYGAFMAEYKNGMKDPAKMADLAKNLQEWSKKATEIGTKLASKPDEAQKWAAWVMELSKSMMPSTPK